MHVFVAIAAAAISSASSAAGTVREESELERANGAWVQCVAARRADYSGSLIKFGPKFQVNGSQQYCAAEIQRVRAAIQTPAIQGTRLTNKEINRLFRQNKNAVIAVYGRLLAAERTGATSPDLPKSCRASVSKGFQAYNVGDHETALCHWLPKARQGDASAQNNMGVLFEAGLTTQTPKSDEEAAKWYLLSAKQGYVLAMRNLAQLHLRLGYNEAANSWLNMATATERIKAESAAVAAYALGCMIGGGCTSPDNSAPRTVTGADTTSIRRTSTRCPNGTYVGGSSCTLAPDGTYVYGRPTLAPDGTYADGTPRLTPDGSYVGGAGRTLLCPDGSYVAGERCILTPAGTYVGG